MSLPERINAMKIVTYDVSRIRDTIIENRGADAGDSPPVDIGDIINWIEDNVDDDIKWEKLILQDENGEEY